MKKTTTYSLVILGSFCSLPPVYAAAQNKSIVVANKSNLLLTMPPILAANNSQGPVKDCNGIPGGTAVVDFCGVCDGDGSSCVLTVTSAEQVWLD